MREARLVNRSIPLRLGVAQGVKSDRGRRSRPRPRLGRGVRFDTRDTRAGAHVDRLEALLPLIENVLQTAGYLVLTIGAVALLFRFAP